MKVGKGWKNEKILGKCGKGKGRLGKHIEAEKRLDMIAEVWKWCGKI